MYLILKAVAGCLCFSWEQWNAFQFVSNQGDTKKNLGRRIFSLVSYRRGKKDLGLPDPIPIIPNPQTNSYQFSRGDVS